MVTGGLAAIIYGEPRLTNDVDVVVLIAPADARRFLEAFAAAEYYLPPVEVVEQEAARDEFGHFNVLHLESSLRADIYCCARNDALGHWGLSRRQALTIGEHLLWLAPIEYVIVQKLRYFRESGHERHLRDIADMLQVSGEAIDRLVLEDWIKRLSLEAEWNKVGRPRDRST